MQNTVLRSNHSSRIIRLVHAYKSYHSTCEPYVLAGYLIGALIDNSAILREEHTVAQVSQPRSPPHPRQFSYEALASSVPSLLLASAALSRLAFSFSRALFLTSSHLLWYMRIFFSCFCARASSFSCCSLWFEI